MTCLANDEERRCAEGVWKAEFPARYLTQAQVPRRRSERWLGDPGVSLSPIFLFKAIISDSGGGSSSQLMIVCWGCEPRGIGEGI